jgi:hypothetical protein
MAFYRFTRYSDFPIAIAANIHMDSYNMVAKIKVFLCLSQADGFQNLEAGYKSYLPNISKEKPKIIFY